MNRVNLKMENDKALHLALKSQLLKDKIDVVETLTSLALKHSQTQREWKTLGPLCCIVQSLTRGWLLATPWTAACHTSPFFTNSRSLLRLMSIESVMPSSHLCCPLPLLPSIFPSIRVFSNKSALYIWWPKYWSSASASIPPTIQWIFRIDFLYDWLHFKFGLKLGIHPSKCQKLLTPEKV